MDGEKKRLEWLELAQIISMLLIVFHHSMPNFTTASIVLQRLGTAVHFPALAVFFFCSGFFSTAWVFYGYREYIKKRAFRLLLPWGVVSILMLLPKALLASDEVRKELLSVYRIGLAFLDPHGQGIMPHLWYLPALFIISLFVPVFEKASKNKIAAIVLLIMTFIGASLSTSFTTVLCINEIRMYLVWFSLGFFVKKNNDPLVIRRDVGLLLAFLVTTGVTLIIIMTPEAISARMPMTVLGFISIFSAAAMAEKSLMPIIIFFRGKTLCIYLWSLCAQNFIEVIAGKMMLDGNISVLCMFITGLAAPLIVYRIIVWIAGRSNRNLKMLTAALGI